MIQPVKKVIRASAGTGKTYRLSLEYIALLLRFHKAGLHFSEILVITFTKKATAEIRERIFKHLADLVNRTEDGKILEENLQSFFGLTVDEHVRQMLRTVLHDMLVNKQMVQISTIDAFTHSIFKTIIAPYLGISDFEIRSSIDDPVMEELYRILLADAETVEKFRSFFEQSEQKKIEDFEGFVKSVIHRRWLFHLIWSSSQPRAIEALAANREELFERVRRQYGKFAQEFQHQLLTHYRDKPIEKMIGKYFKELFSKLVGDLKVDTLTTAFESLCHENELIANMKLLLDDKKNVWNGNTFLKGKKFESDRQHFLQLQQEARKALADWLLIARVLPEEKQLHEIAHFLIDHYDELKFRDKVFTYDDVSYYTFKYLYDPELSLIDHDYVANSFYEQLSAKVRFMLIDEFQDTSILQYKILLPIIREVISGAGIKEYGGAIVVGDEKQSIYGWRGGERDLLLHMPEVMYDNENISLDTSFRSDEKIIRFINEVFSHPALSETLSCLGIDWPYHPIQAYKKNASGYIYFSLRNYSNSKKLANTIATPEEAVREFLKPIIGQLRNGPTVRKTAILARRNRDLDMIADALDELGVSYMKESSQSILDHRAVKPLYLLLTFLAYGDFYDLLRFLRSDAVLLESSALRDLLLAYRNLQEKWQLFHVLQSCSRNSDIAKLLNLLKELEGERDMFRVAQRIIEEYNLFHLFGKSSESDAKNLDHFLTLMNEFRSNRDFPPTIRGFIEYCEQERDRDSFSQVGLEMVEGLSLLTIHKSKGLEFDNVILYWDLSGKAGNFGREMHSYVEYASDYSHLENHLLTFNYDKVIPGSQLADLAEQRMRREAIEELNTLYVALTRAKSNLFMGFVYKSSSGLDTLVGQNSDTPQIARLFAAHVRQVFQEKKLFYVKTTNVDESGTIGEFVPPAFGEEQAKPAFEFHSAVLDADRTALLVEDEERRQKEEHVDFKTVFLKQRAVDFGTAAHYFLSMIRHGTAEEKRAARERTIARFGSLLSMPRLAKMCDELDRFVDQHDELFSSCWKVFNEHTLFAPDGREIRLDRLMIDEERKRIEIVDYKTGHVFEPEQIDLYVETVRSLPAVAEKGFTVSGRFQPIELNTMIEETE